MATKRKTPYTKVILNVPTSLLNKFDIATKRNDYSRSEGIKEAMRLFITDLMGEDWIPPGQEKEAQREMENMFTGMYKGMAAATNGLQPDMQNLPVTNSTVDTSTLEQPRRKRRSKSKKLSKYYKTGK